MITCFFTVLFLFLFCFVCFFVLFFDKQTIRLYINWIMLRSVIDTDLHLTEEGGFIGYLTSCGFFPVASKQNRTWPKLFRWSIRHPSWSLWGKQIWCPPESPCDSMSPSTQTNTLLRKNYKSMALVRINDVYYNASPLSWIGTPDNYSSLTLQYKTPGPG